MLLFSICLFLLIFSIIFFITFPIIKRKLVNEKYDDFCDRKIRKICNKNSFKLINEIEGNSCLVFGNKYIYLISDFYIDGTVKGVENDNSWIYYSRTEKKNKYVDNFIHVLEQNTQQISSISGIPEELFVSIALIPNECNFDVKNVNTLNKFVVHFSSLKPLIKKLENREIGQLNKQQFCDKYNELKIKYGK